MLLGMILRASLTLRVGVDTKPNVTLRMGH